MIVSKKHTLAPKWAYLLLLFIHFSFVGQSQQNVSISDAPMSPDASSVLDVFSTSKGLLIPRMTSVQRLAINNPANALMVFDTDSSCFLFYRSTSSDWLSLCDFTQGPSGPPGDDGIHVQNATVNGMGDLIVTLTDGTIINAGYVVGPDGAQGPQGIQGDQGPIGLTGPDGADGTDGADGAQGPQGIQGEQGPIGLTGPAGADGADGAQGP
ncbi:MAG: collagen-like protein, partial [Crocinitomicaceae bacterium]|nr:collagen-like protein [Crocinitomicaceae bacterium]